MTDVTGGGDPGRLSPGQLAWLKQLSVVLHRRRAYPPKHPTLLAAEESALRALTQALETEPEIVIVVTRRQISIGDATSDPGNPVLGELAERFHRLGVAALTLRQGITAREFETLLDRIASSGPGETRSLEEFSDPEGHVEITTLSYRGLALSSDAEEDEGEAGQEASGDHLWRRLAETALEGWDGEDWAGGSGGGGIGIGAITGVPGGFRPAPYGDAGGLGPGGGSGFGPGGAGAAGAGEPGGPGSGPGLGGGGTGGGFGPGIGPGIGPGSGGGGSGGGFGPGGGPGPGSGVGDAAGGMAGGGTGGGIGAGIGSGAGGGAGGVVGPGGGSGVGGEASDPARLAHVINSRARDRRYARGVMNSLLQVGRFARGRRGRAGSGEVAARLRAVMEQLEPETLGALLEAESDPVRRRLLLLQGVDALPLSAVLDWVDAAAKSSNQSISHYLLRLMRKLASQARRRDDGGPDEGGEAVRQAARELIDGWTLENPNPEAHTSLLEHVAAREPSGADDDSGDAAEAGRIIQIALETDVTGADVIAAVDRLLEEKKVGALLDYLDEADASSVARPAIDQHLRWHVTLRRILLDEPVEPEGTKRLLDRCEVDEVDAILDALSISESRATRQLIVDRLQDMGEIVTEQIVARLATAPWYVQRNLLGLLAALPTLPEGLELGPYFRHEEPTVRVEALRLIVRNPDERGEAIHQALIDPDQRVVRAAMDAAAATGLPRGSLARLMTLVGQADRSPEIRARGIRLLDQVPSPGVRDWLVKRVTQRGGWFRRLRLAPKSPEIVACLEVLGRRWSTDPRASEALRLAQQSRDPEIREAVTVKEPA